MMAIRVKYRSCLLAKTTATVTVVALLAALPATSYATNGMFSHGFSAANSGMGGAGVALPLDALAASTNPAGMVDIGNSSSVGLAYFSPLRSYKVTGAASGGFPPFPGGKINSGHKYFMIPSFGMNWQLDNTGTLGLAVYGNGGMSTDWQASDTPFAMGTFGAGDAGVSYAELFINLNYARKLTDNFSFGVGAIANRSQFKVNGITGFGGFSTSPAKLSNNGYDSDFGFGGIIGVLAKVSDSVSLGASYQSKIKNKMSKYAGLFPNKGEFDIPGTAQVGVAIKAGGGLTFAADVQKIYFSQSDAISASGAGLFACMGGDLTQCLGGSKGAGFGWNDMTVYKFGLQKEMGNGTTWRAGYSYGKQPIDPGEVTLNILAPGVIEQHYTVGMTKKLANNRSYDLAFMYAPEKCQTGASAFNPGQTIEICMHQFQLQGGYNW
ncbi:MAG TPA: hypothetical protein ENI62_09470 [Gammaproteobacteria bacterium]|nr:hypothetical protein [Gammaproteobacteria bacterium]